MLLLLLIIITLTICELNTELVNYSETLLINYSDLDRVIINNETTDPYAGLYTVNSNNGTTYPNLIYPIVEIVNMDNKTTDPIDISLPCS